MEYPLRQKDSVGLESSIHSFSGTPKQDAGHARVILSVFNLPGAESSLGSTLIRFSQLGESGSVEILMVPAWVLV